MSNVDTTIWPDADTVPTGYVREGYAVVRLLGSQGSATIQFPMGPAEQAKYLRALAKVATELADELDPQDGAEA